VHRLGRETEQTELTEDDLRALYAYPELDGTPWVRVNFVSSVDGAVSLDGTSEGLSSPGDKQVFGVLRELCDVVLVGAGTVREEGYRGVRTSQRRRAARQGRGQSDVPPVAVVTSRARIDPTSALFTDTSVAPIILTTEDADPGRTRALQSAGAEVLVVGEDRVDPAQALEALAQRGLVRVLCEGGPGLFGDLLVADLVDEVCVTTAPLAVAGGAGRIARSAAVATARLEVAHVLSDDGALMTRWVRRT
jgi:riboflavin-specific deaminase-like protein